MEHLRRAYEALPEVRLINGYGPTENTTFTCCHTVREADLASHVIPIGRPISGSRVRIVDSHGRIVPVGMPSELHCGGAGLALGYLGQAELTAERFIDGGEWYRSGDLCRWTAEGWVEFLGRIDDQVKVRGFRIEPGEIEAVLAGHPAVRQCKVAARGSGAAGKRLLAWYVPTEGIKAGRGEIRAWLEERLPSFMLPDGIDEVAVMPLNANGKVDVRALPDPHAQMAERAASLPPDGAAEQKLAVIWSEVLGEDSICRDDEFFELGGNSLAGLRMFARIGREFGVSLPLATLLHARTLRDLARVIETGSTSAGTTDADDIGHIAMIRSTGDLPPLVAIHGGDGGVLFYEELARRLPAGRPFLAIESPDLSTSEEIRVESIEVTARNYISLLRQIRPQGPYLLTGYSFGGVVAYEMAAQLTAAGEEIGFLGLIDTLNPAVPVREYSLPERVSVFWKSREDEPLLGRLQSLAGRFREGVETNLRVRSEVAAAASGPAEAHSELRGVQLREAHYQAMLAYRPRSYHGSVTLFRASEKSDKFEFPADYGWQQVAKDFRIVDIPGDHLTVFNRDNVPDLSRRFGESLPGHPG